MTPALPSHGRRRPGAGTAFPRRAGTADRRGLRFWEPAPRDAWSAIAAADPNALAFQTPGWMDALRAAGFSDASRLYELRGQALVVPLARGSLIGRATVASLPYGWGFGGLIASDPVSPSDAAAILHHLAVTTAAVRISVRPDPDASAAWATARAPGWRPIGRLAHVLELDGDFGAVWERRFKSRSRRAVRKADLAGLEVEHGREPRLLDEYQALHRLSLERWARTGRGPAWLTRWRGRLAEPSAKLRAVVDRLGEACEVWVARQAGRPAAAIVVLTHGRTASYWRGAIDEVVAGRTQASHLLHSLAIERACLSGSGRYHFGETGTSSSLAQFKEGFGAVARPYAELRYERLPVTRTVRAAAAVVERLTHGVPPGDPSGSRGRPIGTQHEGGRP